MTDQPQEAATVTPTRSEIEREGPRQWKRISWAEITNLLSVILTASATALSAYAALRANEAAENVATLQAISQFNATINAYSTAGACSKMIVRTYDRAKLASLLQKTAFSFEANEGNRVEASGCLGPNKIVAAGDKVQVSADDSRRIFAQIFNAFNGYEGILLYWNLHNKTERIVCLEVLPGFNAHVRPLIAELKNMPSNPDAAHLLAEYPQLDAFSKIETCGLNG